MEDAERFHSCLTSARKGTRHNRTLWNRFTMNPEATTRPQNFDR